MGKWPVRSLHTLRGLSHATLTLRYNLIYWTWNIIWTTSQLYPVIYLALCYILSTYFSWNSCDVHLFISCIQIFSWSFWLWDSKVILMQVTQCHPDGPFFYPSYTYRTSTTSLSIPYALALQPPTCLATRVAVPPVKLNLHVFPH